MRQVISCITPSPSLSPKGERRLEKRGEVDEADEEIEAAAAYAMTGF
jgi:hypothetical protein